MTVGIVTAKSWCLLFLTRFECHGAKFTISGGQSKEQLGQPRKNQEPRFSKSMSCDISFWGVFFSAFQKCALQFDKIEDTRLKRSGTCFQLGNVSKLLRWSLALRARSISYSTACINCSLVGLKSVLSMFGILSDRKTRHFSKKNYEFMHCESVQS